MYATSRLYRKIDQHEWLTVDEAEHEKLRIVETYIRPYLVGDSAFLLSATLIKCYDDNNALEPHPCTFNHRLIRTRRAVEQAFGQLKGSFSYPISVDNNLSDPHFASEVALVCGALHNIRERWNCPMEDTWLVNSATYNSFHPGLNDADNEDYDKAGWAIIMKQAGTPYSSVSPGGGLNTLVSLLVQVRTNLYGLSNVVLGAYVLSISLKLCFIRVVALELFLVSCTIRIICLSCSMRIICLSCPMRIIYYNVQLSSQCYCSSTALAQPCVNQGFIF